MQRLDQDGSGNIGVQVNGANNTATIYAGAARLTLAFRHKTQRPPTKDLDLLDPYRCPIDLVGRAHELESLKAWLQTSRPIAVQCRIGRAGSGKTRLAIELCRWAEAKGWTAGFLTHEELVRFQRDGHVRAWDWPEPTLVVVDYAATSAQPLRHWLEDLADRDPAERPPLRLLLLERHASGDSGWWSELTRFAGFSTAAVADLLDPPEPLELDRISDPCHRRTLLRSIMVAAAALNSKAVPPELPAPGTDPAFDTAIARDTIELEPLYLLMAGVTAVQTNVPHVLAMTRTDLASRLAERELERLGNLAVECGLDRTLAQHLAAFITLMNGCMREALGDIVTREAGILGHSLPTGPDPAANLLADIFEGEQPWRIEPIRPDLIGEAAILEAFKIHRRPPDWQAATVTRAYDRAASETVATVVRTAQDFATGVLDHPSLLWLDRLADQATDPRQLTVIANELPEQTVNLRERAAVVFSRIADVLRDAISDEPSLRQQFAASLTGPGNWLSDLGRREEALAATEEAVAVYRALAAAHPDAFKPDLATSLNNLGLRLGELGRREEALAATEEAVAVYRALAAARPDAFKPDLAMALNNLGNRLGQLGRREEALAPAEEAVALRRELAAARPDAFKPDLATSLTSLGNRLSDLGRREEALAATEEAVALRRALTAARPDAFKPDLATSLNNLGNRLSELGRREEALAATEEAVALRRALTAARPDAFKPNLAMSLNNLGIRLGELGRCAEALAATEEAVAVYRELAAARPDVFKPDLAVSLFNRSLRLEAGDERAAALASNREAISELASHFLRQPAAFAHWMGPMCAGYVELCEGLGQAPDTALLAPIAEAFQALQATTQTRGDQT